MTLSKSIQGLPEGALLQTVKGKRYVYFAYNFRSEGRIKQERDYIGTVDETDCFVPNYFYTTARPTRSHRDPERWKDPVKREQALREQAQELKIREQAQKQTENDKRKYHDLGLPVNGARCVGLTAVAVAFLYRNGLIEDLYKEVFGDLDTVIRVVNLAVCLAVTSKPTYLAAAESDIQQFIGQKCLSSPRASEFFETIGSNLDLSTKITAARIKRVPQDALLALDGTRVNSHSEQIGLAAVGKKKDGTFDSQINYSMLVNATEGTPIGYRMFAGNVNDMATIEDFRAIWTDCGLHQTKATIVMDRGYFSEAAMTQLHHAGFKFLIGAKTNFRQIQRVINDRNMEFYASSGLIRHRHCYGVKDSYVAQGPGGAARLMTYTFRSPSRETEETDEFLDALDRVEAHWQDDKLTAEDRNLLGYFQTPRAGHPLKRKEDLIREDSYLFGYFAMIGNINEDLAAVLDKYEQRNEVEVLFRLMFGHLIKTTRVHSTRALEALMLIVFVGISALTSLRSTMARTPTPKAIAKARNEKPSMLSELFSISEIFQQLQHVMLCRDRKDEFRLLNVTSKDRALVQALGFDGLFDDPENVAKMLSPTYMKERLGL